MTDTIGRFSQEELLGRPTPPLDLVGAEELIAGRRVLVTGAAGSVGGPLTLQLARLRPASLILLDHHEHSLFRLKLEAGPRLEVPARWVLADLRDRRKLERVFREGRPEVVFHMAAYKHVPLGEENPDQTVEVNLGGTRALIETAAEHGTIRFVYPSSDKAVNPPSVYGSTKRIAERLTQAAEKEMSPGFSIVRFVNIVGTRGSVIETFLAQIAAGKPLTLTDPGMTRYWITMAEATRLVLQTAAAPNSGVVYMPDAGEPINLAELARHLYGLLVPGRTECPIQYIGPRPGERMHEILLSDYESAIPTPYPGILQVLSSRSDLPTYQELSSQIDSLLRLAHDDQLAALRGRVLDLANSLQ
ncbi:MAG: polysaccharide biosynthesis protein [Sphingomonadaceae bacterium]